ncbi:MAG: transglutaminase-like domain-containing protein [Verrucomicrobiota bacterium]
MPKSFFIPFVFFFSVCALLGQDYNVDDPPQGLFDEQWMEVYLDGQKAGYFHSTIRREGELIISSDSMVMSIRRGAASLSFRTTEQSVESISGEPQAFQLLIDMAGQPITTQGKIENGQISQVTDQFGNVQRTTVPYPKGALMAWGLNRKMMQLPLRPGTETTVKMFSPSMSMTAAAEAQYRVLRRETIDIQGKTVQAWRAELDTKIGGTSLVTTVWVDEDKRMLKNEVNIMGMPMVLVATDEATALASFLPAEIFETNLVSLGTPIPRHAEEVVYKVSLTNSEAMAQGIPEDAYQSVKPDGPGQYLVTVTRADHAALGGEELAQPEAMADFIEPNLVLDTEDTALRDLARKALEADKASEPKAKADQLRRFVTDYIEEKNLTVGFATASEVARTPQGDCSEHAVLLAALGRIHGIPSRVAAGLLYMPRFPLADGEIVEDVMGYHMWTQFYLDGRWVDFDAAQDESECAPTRLILMTSSLRESSITEIGLELINLIGQIEVTVDEVR